MRLLMRVFRKHPQRPLASCTPGCKLVIDCCWEAAPPQFACNPQGFCVSSQVEEPAEAERVFRELGESGVVQVPIGETFWACRFGMLIDKFGTPSDHPLPAARPQIGSAH